MLESDKKIGILFVDDNPAVARAIEIKLSDVKGYEWKGWLPSADLLVETALDMKPALVLLDIDMPGRDPFEAAAELAKICPECRTVVFSGHVRRDYIERALQAGAWGYVSKNDGEEELLKVLDKVLKNEVAFSPEVRLSHDMKI